MKLMKGKNGMFCSKCGVKVPDDSVFCFKCGYKLVRFEMQDKQPAQTPLLISNKDSEEYLKEEKKGNVIYLTDIAMFEYGIYKINERISEILEKIREEKETTLLPQTVIWKWYKLKKSFNVTGKPILFGVDWVGKYKEINISMQLFPNWIYENINEQDRIRIFGDKDYGLFINDKSILISNKMDGNHIVRNQYSDGSWYEAGILRLDNYCFYDELLDSRGPVLGYEERTSLYKNIVYSEKDGSPFTRKRNFFQRVYVKGDPSKLGVMGIDEDELDDFLFQLKVFIDDTVREMKLIRQNIDQEFRVKNENVRNLDNELRRLKKDKNKATSLLKSFYDLNIIPIQYREIGAITFILNYYKTSNVPLNEVFFHTDLDDIKQNQKSIINRIISDINQNVYMISQNDIVLQQNLETLEQLKTLSSDAQEANRWAIIQANNAETCAWALSVNYFDY